MSKYMNDSARPERWKRKSAQFVVQIWSPFKNGFGFLGTRSISDRWREHCFEIGEHYEAVFDHFSRHHRDEFDHYFCPNVFSKPRRKAVDALPTPYSWADIDDADPEAFAIPPGILFETSPGRTQGLWSHADLIPACDAALHSKGLAYKYDADRNGWSATKYPRVPFTVNHKLEYHQPIVRLIRSDFEAQPWEAVPISQEDWGRSRAPVVNRQLNMPKDWREVYKRYRKRMHPRVRFLINEKVAYSFECDRSKCIYEIVAEMNRVGAEPQEIAAVLWHNPFFLSKYGKDLGKLNEELWRILGKLGARHE